MLKRSNLILIVIALVLALVAALLVTKEMKNWQQAHTPQAAPQATVYVAIKNVPIHTLIDKTDLQAQQVPANSVEKGVITDPNQIIGQYTLTQWIPGQQIISGMVGDAASAAFALQIPKGYRAFTIPNDTLDGVDHLLSPGDHVDILLDKLPPGAKPGAVTSTTVETLYQNVEVLYVDVVRPDANPAAKPPSTTPAADTITIAVTPQQAAQLEYISGMGGKLRLDLRNPADSGTVNVPNVTKMP